MGVDGWKTVNRSERRWGGQNVKCLASEGEETSRENDLGENYNSKTKLSINIGRDCESIALYLHIVPARHIASALSI